MRSDGPAERQSWCDPTDQLERLFSPRSVALVGATDHSQWSAFTHANLRRYSPAVTVHLVHPVHEVVHGQRAVSSLAAIGEPVDLAFLMVPTEVVLPAVEQAANAGIRNIVMLTAGFAEAGPVGVDLQRRLLDLATERDLTILGPNGNGFINARAPATPYGLPITPPLIPGPVGIVLQSGALASAVLAGAQAGGLGVSLLVSTGNEMMVSATDIMRHLVADEQTQVIAAFLESIRQPQEFREVAELALKAGKPIVACKVGRSEAAARTALAHTGALAGDDRVVDGAFRQLGVIRVDSLEELLATAGYLGHHSAVDGRRMAVVTASGGACDLVADKASAEGLQLPEFPQETLAELQALLPPFSNPHNPLDVTGYVVVDPKLALEALAVVARTAADRYDMVVYVTALPRVDPADTTGLERRLDALTAAGDHLGVPLLVQTSISADLTPLSQRLLAERTLYLLDGIDLGTRAIGHGARYHERRDRWMASDPTTVAPPVEPPAGAAGVWPEHLVRGLLAEHGIPMVPARLVTSAGEAGRVAAAMSQPLAMKVASAQVVHKSDVGGIRLAVAPDDAPATFSELETTVAAACPDAALDGVLISPMRAGGVELLVGIVTDPAWGKLLSVGLGGVWVETMGDVALRVLPVDEDEVRAMLAELRGAQLLHGGHGTGPANISRVVEAILGVARLAEGLGEALDMLEINPLRVDGDQVEVVDAVAGWRDEIGDQAAATAKQHIGAGRQR